MSNFFDSKNKKDCNGCGACALRCPKNAITMKEDDEGFLYPYIDESKCIHCGICKKICSNVILNNESEDTYIAINKNKDVLLKSSSGGIFTILAEYTINKGGIVYGVTYDKNFEVVHDHINKLEDIKKFRYSKYVRSNLKNSFIEIEKFLKNGQYVLFTGTPCQCAGLRSYLRKKYDNLITCEIICHSNASPKIFKMFINNVETQYKKKIKNIIFRYKKYGWHGSNTYVIFDSNEEIEISCFTDAFLSNLICRPSCSSCIFCTSKRYSDFTIGDFWGIDKTYPSIVDDNTGISLLNVNSDKGRRIFNEVKDKMFTKKVDTNKAFLYNHNHNNPYHINRNHFFELVKKGKINDKNVINNINKCLSVNLFKKYAYKIYYKVINSKNR